MKNGKNKRKGRIGMLLAAFLTAGGMIAAPSFAAGAFTDVQQDYWARADIALAAEKGIVNGYETSAGVYAFYPENPVSCEEAAAMLYRALRAAGKQKDGDSAALIEKHKEALQAAGISEWAQEYVAYGLENGIIGSEELASFVDPNTKAGKPVRRITVAVWTAKALEKQRTGLYYLPFTDASQISDANAPYIDILYRHGIMKGSWQPDGTIAFQPESGVKRSEFAAISNRVLTQAEAGYDSTKETYSRMLLSSETIPGARIRLAADADIIGSQRGAAAVSGMSFAAGEAPQVFFVGTPEQRSGEIVSSEKLSSDTVKVGIRGTERTVYYLLTEKTKNTAPVRTGEEVLFLADGVRLVEMKSK